MGFVDNYEGSLALSNGLKEALNKVLPKKNNFKKQLSISQVHYN